MWTQGPYEEEVVDTDIGHVTVEADTGVRSFEEEERATKWGMQPPEAGKTKRRMLPEASRRSKPWQPLGSGLVRLIWDSDL